MFVDSHCHLSFPELAGRIADIRSDMAAADVSRALLICTTLEEFDSVHAITVAHDNFWCTAGVHPDNEDVREPDEDALIALARRPKVVGIGETGLDYYRIGSRSHDQMEWQRERYRVHIRVARSTGLPLVIHTRSASDDTVAILREEGARSVSGVFHCFTETAAVARAALDLGFMISFSGILTFKNAHELRDVARFVPLDRCLIETDSPYLAPVPHRGKVNTPALVPWVARQLAEIKGLSVEQVARAISENFERLFGLPAEATEVKG